MNKSLMITIFALSIAASPVLPRRRIIRLNRRQRNPATMLLRNRAAWA